MFSSNSLPDISEKDIITAFGLSSETFYSLPYKYQKKLIFNYLTTISEQDEIMVNDNIIKKKILGLFKRR